MKFQKFWLNMNPQNYHGWKIIFGYKKLWLDICLFYGHTVPKETAISKDVPRWRSLQNPLKIVHDKQIRHEQVVPVFHLKIYPSPKRGNFKMLGATMAKKRQEFFNKNSSKKFKYRMICLNNRIYLGCSSFKWYDLWIQR